MTLAAAVGRRSNRKAKGDGHLRRAEILEAASRIFTAEGYEGATIRKIADEVGVSSTALYMHFPDKAAILLEICEATFKELSDRNTEIAARPLDAVTRVRMILEEYMRWALAHPNAYALIYPYPRPASESQSEALTALKARSYQAFSSVAQEIAGEGRLRLGDGHGAAQVMWMACHGVIALTSTLPHFQWAASQDEMMSLTLDGLLKGFVLD